MSLLRGIFAGFSCFPPCPQLVYFVGMVKVWHINEAYLFIYLFIYSFIYLFIYLFINIFLINLFHFISLGSAKVVRSAELGNVISLVRRGGGWVDLG